MNIHTFKRYAHCFNGSIFVTCSRDYSDSLTISCLRSITQNRLCYYSISCTLKTCDQFKLLHDVVSECVHSSNGCMNTEVVFKHGDIDTKLL